MHDHDSTFVGTRDDDDDPATIADFCSISTPQRIEERREDGLELYCNQVAKGRLMYRQTRAVPIGEY